MAYVDIHVHIDYYKDFKKVYEKYEEKKIYTLFVTNLPEIYEACFKSLPKSKYIKLALGYNPQMSKTEKFNKKIFEEYLSTTQYVGEVGLDFSREFIINKTAQLQIFDYVVKRSTEENKIISVHSRKAEIEVLKILDKYKAQCVVFHWFTGSFEMIDEIVKKGYYFSVNAQMLNSAKGKKIVHLIPIERMLFESDGPFAKINGIEFRPEKIEDAYKVISKNLKVNKFNDVVFNNLKKLLNIQNIIRSF